MLGLRFCARAFSSCCGKRGHSSSRCAGLSLSWPLPLRSTGSRRAGSVVVAHGLSCSAACGILPDQGSNPCPLHWQADSQPLRHQGNPQGTYYYLPLTPSLKYLYSYHTVDKWQSWVVHSGHLDPEPILFLMLCCLYIRWENCANLSAEESQMTEWSETSAQGRCSLNMS